MHRHTDNFAGDYVEQSAQCTKIHLTIVFSGIWKRILLEGLSTYAYYYCLSMIGFKYTLY